MASCAVKGKSLPEWFKLLPANARVNSRDTAKLFGMTEGSLKTAAYNRTFPAADAHVKGHSSLNACMWEPSTLLAEWKRRRGLP